MDGGRRLDGGLAWEAGRNRGDWCKNQGVKESLRKEANGQMLLRNHCEVSTETCPLDVAEVAGDEEPAARHHGRSPQLGGGGGEGSGREDSLPGVPAAKGRAAEEG